MPNLSPGFSNFDEPVSLNTMIYTRARTHARTHTYIHIIMLYPKYMSEGQQELHSNRSLYFLEDVHRRGASHWEIALNKNGFTNIILRLVQASKKITEIRFNRYRHGMRRDEVHTVGY